MTEVTRPLISLELRWFFSRELPPELETWFTGQLPESEIKTDTRDDTYLLTPTAPEVGIKIRKKKPELPYSLEVKWRQWVSRFHGSNGLAGNVERWIKWDWEDPKGPDTGELQPWSMPQGPWIIVGKKRLQRKYRWDASQKQFLPEPPDNYPELGAVIEVTHLRLGGRANSTVLVESFAPDERQQMDLLGVAVRTLWTEFPAGVVVENNSIGYPAWLARQPMLGALRSPAAPPRG